MRNRTAEIRTINPSNHQKSRLFNRVLTKRLNTFTLLTQQNSCYCRLIYLDTINIYFNASYTSDSSSRENPLYNETPRREQLPINIRLLIM